MSDAGRREALCSEAWLEQPSPEVAAMVRAYLKLANGDPGQALVMAATDGIAVTKLVSTGYARWRQPERSRMVVER